MNGLDWTLVSIGIFCALRGIMRGAISQVFGIAGVVGGFLLAAHYYQPLAIQIGKTFPSLSGVPAVGFALLFFLTWLCLGVAGHVLTGLLRKTGLGFVDRIWGGGVGVGKALVLAVVMISIMTFFLSPQSDLLRQSKVTPYVQEAAVLLVSVTPISVQKLFHEKKKQLELYWSQPQGPGLSIPTPLKREAVVQQ